MHSTNLRKHFVVLLSSLTLLAGVASGQDASDKSSAKEQQLLAVLRSDSPAAEKALTCKLLAIHGSSKAVPDLAKLLPNPQLSSWARIALEAIPGEASDEALRNALNSLQGKLLIGTINSIGVRRDAKAVTRLAEHLKNPDKQAASAAAVALGRIGNAAATKTLREALKTADAKVRSSVAEGCVLCAERLLEADKASEAIAVYEQVRAADVPLQRKIEATRGAILARKQEGLPLLLELFRSPNKKMFQLALGTAREFPGGKLDKALAGQLADATPQRAVLLIQVMADRPETVVVSALVAAAEKGPKQVRESAVQALGRIGDASTLATLLNIATGDDQQLAQTAGRALSGLSGEKVNQQIIAKLRKSEGKSYALLIDLVGQRRIKAVPDLLKALQHEDQAVRTSALAALGETVSLKQLPVLISEVVTPRRPEDAGTAQKALRAASVRMPNREACATELAKALDKAKLGDKVLLLEIMADVGGSKSLQTLAEAAKSKADELQDASSRLLGKWNGVEAAPVLMDLAKTAPANKYRIRALRGYIGLARKFAMPDPKRAEMCRNALAAATRTPERKLVLDVLKLRPSKAGLAIAIEAVQTPELKEPATLTAIVIARKLGGNVNIGKQLAQAGLKRVKLEIIKAEYGAGSTQRDVTALVRKHAGDLQLIVLPNASYNAALGGDPSPGNVKRLKIQYRIDGKDGVASFAENALIFLPAVR